MQGCFPSKYCLWCSLTLSLYCGGLRCWVANYRVLFSSSSWVTHNAGVAWATLASITLWSPFVHLLVILYGWASNPPSLPWYMMDGDPRERCDSIVFSNILLCAHIMSKEALVAVLGRHQACEITCPLLCVVPDSDISPLSGMRAY